MSIFSFGQRISKLEAKKGVATGVGRITTALWRIVGHRMERVSAPPDTAHLPASLLSAPRINIVAIPSGKFLPIPPRPDSPYDWPAEPAPTPPIEDNTGIPWPAGVPRIPRLVDGTPAPVNVLNYSELREETEEDRIEAARMRVAKAQLDADDAELRASVEERRAALRVVSDDE